MRTPPTPSRASSLRLVSSLVLSALLALAGCADSGDGGEEPIPKSYDPGRCAAAPIQTMTQLVPAAAITDAAVSCSHLVWTAPLDDEDAQLGALRIHVHDLADGRHFVTTTTAGTRLRPQLHGYWLVYVDETEFGDRLILENLRDLERSIIPGADLMVGATVDVEWPYVSWQDSGGAVQVFDIISGTTRRVTPVGTSGRWSYLDGGRLLTVVYVDDPNGPVDKWTGATELHLYDLVEPESPPLVFTTSGPPQTPGIYGDLVAWREKVGPSTQVVAADVRTGLPFNVRHTEIPNRVSASVGADHIVWIEGEQAVVWNPRIDEILYLPLGGIPSPKPVAGERVIAIPSVDAEGISIWVAPLDVSAALESL